MSDPTHAALPRRILDALAQHHAGGVTEQDCLACSAPCCSQGGFAILENVQLIYRLYRDGELVRDDFNFDEGLSFRDFVIRYFDFGRYQTEAGGEDKEIVLFHMKNVALGGEPLSVPNFGNYWESRLAWFRANPWMNRGCVFLNRRVRDWPHDDGNPDRLCLLHGPQSLTHVTAKPIDCLFFTCTAPIDAKVPDEDQTAAWFALLAEEFPGSVTRFEELLRQEAGA